ncbi:hypothetical protein [Azospirillum sp. B2RO_4]|uniref:hypothetical protein n=1 Tax=Azospirillum sp. B2RO_4 TaxID=3027796 RepID=UPI003DA9A727
MTRDEARALWASSGLDYSVLTHELLHRLVSLIDAELRAKPLFRDYRMNRSLSLRFKGEKPIQAELRCRGFYFRSREAVTFQSDGFIGFCGWASDENAAPILEGFRKWVASLQRDELDVPCRAPAITQRMLGAGHAAFRASVASGVARKPNHNAHDELLAAVYRAMAVARGADALGSTLNDGRGA